MDHEKVKTVVAPVPLDCLPLKLRSACNQCFAAKVRCDGNKNGCSRCLDKRLQCTFSESRVGKVVGKRRKRPLDDSVGLIDSNAWVINNYTPPHSTPSPSPSNASDSRSKRSCTESSWTSFTASSEQPSPYSCSIEEQPQTCDLSGVTSFHPANDFMLSMGDLPTPELSPPEAYFISPMVHGSRVESRLGSIAPQMPHLTAPMRPSWAAQKSELVSVDDEETICIKLLSHLKRYSADVQGTSESVRVLIEKSVASVRRITRSKNVHTDYPCQLLLSNIMIRIVGLCENACKMQFEELEMANSLHWAHEQFAYDMTSASYDPNSNPLSSTLGPTGSIGAVVQETLDMLMVVGHLLKRKPYSGYQTMGRHESLHLALEQRLRTIVGSLGAVTTGTS